jgi:UDP-3-O-[3-hydroxymyristoyl] glucosamine N-acyltransferase
VAGNVNIGGNTSITGNTDIAGNVFLTTAGNVNQQVEIRAITEATGYNTGRWL